MPKAPVMTNRIIEILKNATEPLTVQQVAEMAETTRQNAYNVVQERLVPVELVKRVGKSDTGGILYAWDEVVAEKGVEPAARERVKGKGASASRPERGRSMRGASRGSEARTRATDGVSSAGTREAEQLVQRARIRVGADGGIEVLEITGLSEDQLMAFAAPLVGTEIKVKELRVGEGGVVKLEVVMGGRDQTIELKPVA